MESGTAREKLWNANYIKVWTSNFLMSFAFMLINPLLPLFLTDHFGADKQMIGITLAGYALAALLIRPFSGYFIDHFPRKIVLLLSYGLSCCFFLGYMAATTLTVFAFFRTVHGFPFGTTTVSCTTLAVDTLPASRRAEGIGYYGLSANLGSAVGPTVALWIFDWTHSYNTLFLVSFLVTLVGVVLGATLKLKPRPVSAAVPVAQPKRLVSLDRFLLLKASSQAVCTLVFGLSYSIVTTYLAIYGREELGITGGTGLFFLLLAAGLIASRLMGSKSLGEGKIVQNGLMGMLIAVVGYAVFAGIHHPAGYYGSALIIGFGQGFAWPAFLNMFLDLAPHERRGTANATILTSWDLGLGLGMLLGGITAQHAGYHAAFWLAVA
ncbi:MAG: MFS transporter, partial [Paludibacteraceae bacterium]|nr:MFS transporter [Paludibacteraceae bacterium]